MPEDYAELLKKTASEISEMDLAQAAAAIKDRLLSPSSSVRAVLAAEYKAARPDISYERIFEAFDYAPHELKSVLSALNEYHHVIADGRRVWLGYRKLDALLRGLRPGQVCGLMARASVGKTTWAINIVCRQHAPVLFFSLEMPASEIAARLYAVDRKVRAQDVEEAFAASINDPRVAKWSLKYRDLVIVDRAGLSLEDMAERYKRASKDLGKHIPLVVIDYLGLIRGPGANSYERTSYVARNLKILAKDTGAAVIVLLQASRAAGTGAERITLDMARDSGQIEEACDFVLGAWRPDIGKEDDSGDFKLDILKNRHGRLGWIDMHFDLEHLAIEEV